MAGIYIHIPFCKQACHYCNFHFSTSTAGTPALVEALEREIESRREFFPEGTVISTLYLGGGTPSLLTLAQLDRLIAAVRRSYRVADALEITLEANPDDLTAGAVGDLQSAGVTRLSIGIQSFDDALLQYMNRAHSSREAYQALDRVFAAGFDQISADLIYGIPGLTTAGWESDLVQLTDYPVHHLSCYALTVEPKTALDHFIRKKGWQAPDDNLANEQFLLASALLGSRGFDHYEISNFARDRLYSRHNTAYWQGEAYLGIGPSAHSYRPYERSWNIANNAKYIAGIRSGTPSAETEQLSDTDRLNEYLMTGLRTKWGIDLNTVRSDFGEEAALHIEQKIREVNSGLYVMEGSSLRLTKLGWLWSDSITSALFVSRDS